MELVLTVVLEAETSFTLMNINNASSVMTANVKFLLIIPPPYSNYSKNPIGVLI